MAKGKKIENQREEEMKHLTAVLLVGGIFMFSGCGDQERMDLLIGMYGELEAIVVQGVPCDHEAVLRPQ